MKRGPILLVFIACLILCSCGGGGSSSSNQITQPPPPVVTPPPPVISITSPSNLPGATAGVPYSYTFTESGGTAPFTWKIINGLSIMSLSPDGVLSGTSPQYLGGLPSVALTVQVTDSATPPNTATKLVSLDILGLQPLSFPVPQVSVLYNQSFLSALGGTEPITWSLSGTAPPGLSFIKNPASSDTREYGLVGTPAQSGSYNFAITVSDSSTPQRSETVNFTVQVEPSPLTLSNNQLPIAIVGQPYSYSFSPQGGAPPFKWQLMVVTPATILPGGLAFDAAGAITGIPSAPGNANIQVQVIDSSVPRLQGVTNNYNVLVEPTPLPNRNDSIADATPIYPGTYVAAISPFGDPTGAVAPDQDYYQYTAQGGSTVFISVANQVFAYGGGYTTSPLDPVIELVDGTGQQLTTCNDPLNDNPSSGSVIPQDATPTGFDDACMDWDGNTNPTPGGKTSSLTLKVPGDPSTQSTFYIHVFDWRGDARPDMLYTLTINQQ